MIFFSKLKYTQVLPLFRPRKGPFPDRLLMKIRLDDYKICTMSPDKSPRGGMRIPNG